MVVPPSPTESPSRRFLLRRIVNIAFLRNIMMICLAVALFFPLYNIFYISPSYNQLLSRYCEDQGQRVAQFLVRTLSLDTRPLTAGAISAEQGRQMQVLKTDFDLVKLKLFDRLGRVVFSTDATDIGTINRQPYFSDRIAKGRTVTRMSHNGGRTLENQPLESDVVEVYVPVMAAGTFHGALEIYYDITVHQQALQGLLMRTNGNMIAIALVLVTIMVLIVFKAAATIMAHEQADHELTLAHRDLEKRIQMRTGDLVNANQRLQKQIRERHQAEAALRESEKRFRTLVETTPHGIQEIDTQGIITFANPAHARIYGCATSELVGTSILDLAASPHEAAKLREHLDYLITQQPHPSPWFGRDRTRDGRCIDTQVDWHYKRNRQMQVVGFICVISDITHRKQAEKALLDNLQFMNTLIDTIPNPVFYKDADGVFMGCNTAFAQTVLGRPKEQILGRRVIDLDLAADSQRARLYHRRDMRLIGNPGIQSYEDQILCADGHLRDYVCFMATFRDNAGQVAGLVGIMLDITARKRAEDRLRQSQRLFDAFMRHLPSLAFMKDLEGHYLFVNDAYTRMAGHGSDHFLNHVDDQLWDTATAEMIRQNDAHVLETKAAATVTETAELGGQRRHLLTTRFPIFRDTELYALAGISMDVTQRTRDEQHRKELEMQLQQAQKMEALGTLAGGIAHDFNNILAAVIGYAEIALVDAEKESALHGYLTRVLEAGDRARQLVKQILAFSRQSELEPKPVQVKLIVKEVLKLLRASLPATIDIEQQIHTDAAVMADPVQIHQVMMNLCTNAGHAMRDQGGKLTVSLARIDLESPMNARLAELAPGPFVRLSVADTGHGISEEHVQRIFDPFFTTKTKGEGTGMGLAVVHGIVAALHGAVTVDSRAGEGARFDVYLPAIESSADIAAPAADKLPVGTERILFVDDEVFQADMLKQMLGLLGYKVQTSTSGQQALELFAREAFDLVITDMTMPQMTGEVLARKILEMNPDMPVILCTGYSDLITEEKARAIGIRAFVLKPLVMEKVAVLIRSVLDEPAPAA